MCQLGWNPAAPSDQVGVFVGPAAARNVGLLPGHAWRFRFWFQFWLLWVSISSFLSSDDILCLPAEYLHREKLAPRGRRSNALLSPCIYQLESHELIPSSKEGSGFSASPWKRGVRHLVFPCFVVMVPSSLQCPTWSSPCSPRLPFPPSQRGSASSVRFLLGTPNQLLVQSLVPRGKWSWRQRGSWPRVGCCFWSFPADRVEEHVCACVSLCRCEREGGAGPGENRTLHVGRDVNRGIQVETKENSLHCCNSCSFSVSLKFYPNGKLKACVHVWNDLCILRICTDNI